MKAFKFSKSNKNFPEAMKAQKRREKVEEFAGQKFNNIGKFCFDPRLVVNRNCENMIGTSQVPLGIAGPLNVGGKNYLLPLATTEGSLVASVNRGCKATFQSGVNVFLENIGTTRGPVFKVSNVEHGLGSIDFLKRNWSKMQKIVKNGEKHLTLKDFSWQLIGKNLYLRFVFDTNEAMGMNMVTMATDKLAAFLSKNLKINIVSLSGNYCIDKKPAWLNFIEGRGKKAWAEAEVDKKIVKSVLKTTPEKIVEVVNKKCLLGSVVSGSIGFNAHYANIIAAIFIATGQDPAHVVEGSLGVTTAEVQKNGDLYFSVYLPDLMVGTVGGGTHLPTQKEALAILGFGEQKNGESLIFAKIIGAAVLAGELSLIAALSAGHLTRAHQKLGRGKE